jgi:hypothetical protein
LSEALVNLKVERFDAKFWQFSSCLSVFAKVRDDELEYDRLENMLDVSFAAEATDPRDLVFGILSMLNRQPNLDPNTIDLERDTGAHIRPDYTASVGEVYSEMTAVRLRHDGLLDFLNVAGMYDGKYEGLCSWAVDLTKECASVSRFAECTYCPQSRVGEYIDTTSGEEALKQLVIRARIIDEIGNTVPPLIPSEADYTEDGTSDIEGMATRLESLRASLKASSSPAESASVEFWKTIAMYDDHCECSSRRNKNKTENGKFVAFAAELDRWLDGDNSHIVDSEIVQSLDAARKLDVRSFFTTTNGRFGSIDNRPIQVGDQIAVCVGSRAPLLLRTHAGLVPGVYQLIGMAYVQGKQPRAGCNYPSVTNE